MAAQMVVTVCCPRCMGYIRVTLDPDCEDDWIRLARVSRRLRDDGHKVAVPLIPQLMEPEERN